MDSLTQIVLGAAVGELVLGKKVGNKAILWGAIAGTIPDLDVFSSFWAEDIIQANEWHRGITHSFFFSVVMAPIFAWLLTKIEKRSEANWKDWTKLMFWSLVTHPLLDAHTTWGTQLFWPLPYKISYNNIFVVDPLYTIPFMVFLILAMRLPKLSPKRRFWNNLGLIISGAYMFLTFGFKYMAYTHFETFEKAQNIDYVDITTRPTPLNSILWTANIETPDSFLIAYYSLLDDAQKKQTWVGFPKNHEGLGNMKSEDKIERLIRLSEHNYTIVNQGDTLIFNDLRFGKLEGDSPKPDFVFSFQLFYDATGKLQVREVPKSFKNVGEAFSKLWNRIKG